MGRKENGLTGPNPGDTKPWKPGDTKPLWKPPEWPPRKPLAWPGPGAASNRAAARAIVPASEKLRNTGAPPLTWIAGATGRSGGVALPLRQVVRQTAGRTRATRFIIRRENSRA